MGPVVEPVDPEAHFPTQADVVVIGGGIIGVSAAHALAERGISVALCEKGQIAGEQSSRNWGWVRKTGRDQREMPLIMESLRIWEGLDKRIGADTGFKAAGILYVAETEAVENHHSAWLQRAEPYQMGVRQITPDEIAKLLPNTTKRFRSALYCPTDGRAEPQKAAPAIARAARVMGASILTNCAVRGIERTAGRVSAVVTEQGRIACNAVILAGGAWTRLFCGSLGLTLPQLKVLSSVMRTAPLDGAPEPAAWTNDFAFRRRQDGGYTIADGHGTLVPIVPDTFRFATKFLPALKAEWKGLRLRLDDRFMTEARTPKTWALDAISPFETTRVLDPTPDVANLMKVKDRLIRAFPAFAGMKIEQHWAGLIDAMPDAVPVISTVDTMPGLVIATGFSGHGFGIGPAAGRLAADLATGSPPIVDPTAFRFSRFSDGSPIIVEAGL
ncbi:FAD-binding oxidoreductase [Acidisoma cellulosilytica]|uniref:FAD-binding oxidoreductase n=1 Tax=Acidisoma cellulosilyticum TaxID=2802395 RepID=A0A963Z801_9PROT|nr:FAD-binding oxidoreductase [Acidisoma cellulosilyticum]MCB8883542.1 FAD-binding oxidoreductase [Acidisoma cellulosilyticum]